MFLVKVIGISFICMLLLSFAQSYVKATHSGVAINGQHWSTARRDSAEMAPDPQKFIDTAIVQVYTAPTFGWRGLFAVHPWIIFKKAGESQYHRYEVVSWGSSNVIRHNYALPDGYWFGAKPRLLVDHRGERAAAMIPAIEAAIGSYPWPRSYRVWPGPNSNTFLAHIGREVPELKLDLPANAIGKDFRPLSRPVGLPASGKGVQISLLGVLGLTLGAEEGVEFNVLAFNFGIDFKHPALRLPFTGRLGTNKIETDSGG
ncbi:DUF3750 domain-containing protein [Erwinia sp. 198]|uniref:DUF3750 domain-containing protein n=1 Tax=Erwinia sp. 198 TaxID=2022746 RepID=UPI000F687C96|nr:DUF3750 domain-containing protein [Erwinia sp. 198]RRZ92926.1 DUF3750 domain-containing protein [Erwinia sp. 198]